MKHIIILGFLLLSTVVHGQNIFTALHLNEEGEYKTRRPKMIKEKKIFYNSSGKTIETTVKTFDPAGLLLTEERFDINGKITARLTYVNDTARRLALSRTFERWTRFGPSTEIAFYTYDNNKCLVSTIDKDLSGRILTQTHITCNDKGYPSELVVLDERGNSFGKETATYYYDRNRVITSVISNDGRILSTDSGYIRFNAHLDSSKLNNNGDPIIGSTRKPDGSTEHYEYEYTYDSYGNVTEEAIYVVTIKGNGKKKRKIDRVFQKEYAY